AASTHDGLASRIADKDCDLKRLDRRLRREMRDIQRWRRRHRHRNFLALDVDNQPLETGAESNARGRRATQQLCKPVVPAATSHAALRAFLQRMAFKDRARVVVQTPYEAFIDFIRDLLRVEISAKEGEVITAWVEQKVR